MFNVHYDIPPKVEEFRVVNLNQVDYRDDDLIEVLATIPCENGFLVLVRETMRPHDQATLEDIGSGE